MVASGCASEAGEVATEAGDPTTTTDEVPVVDSPGPGPTPAGTEDTAATTQTTDPAPASTAGTGGDAVDLLRIAPESDGGVAYDRDEYGGWTTGSDGCRTRDTVLIRDARPPGAQVDPYGCTVLAGEWTDPYTNEAVVADDRREVSDLVHIDHVVALSEAHDSGAWRWDRPLKRDFANDLDNLLATAASVNTSKSDRDPASWQPPALDRWCAFTEIWILTKVRWDLTADRAEADALRNMRSARSCPDDLTGQ